MPTAPWAILIRCNFGLTVFNQGCALYFASFHQGFTKSCLCLLSRKGTLCDELARFLRLKRAAPCPK